MKTIAEAFQQAIDEKIPQIVGTYRDWEKPEGFCATGWLRFKLGIPVGPLIKAMEREFPEIIEYPVLTANDDWGWTWEQFRDFARKHGL